VGEANQSVEGGENGSPETAGRGLGVEEETTGVQT